MKKELELFKYLEDLYNNGYIKEDYTKELSSIKRKIINTASLSSKDIEEAEEALYIIGRSVGEHGWFDDYEIKAIRKIIKQGVNYEK